MIIEQNEFERILKWINYMWIFISLSKCATFNVTRVFNNGDVFNTLMDDSKCDPKNCAVYRAVSVRSSPCYCQCPMSRPAFLQHMKHCSDSIDDCKKTIEFNNFNHAQGQKVRIPSVFIPLAGQIVNPNGPPDWKGAGVNVDEKGSVPCRIFNVGYLSKDGFTPAENAASLFSMLVDNGYTYFQWMGSKQDQIQLSGKIVQVLVQCESNVAPEFFCAVFRIVGKDGPTTVQDLASVNQNNSNVERSNQLGLIVGIVCGVLLAVTLISVAIFWTVCWRQQKERLARKIQLHVMYQQRLQQQNGGVFQHFGQAFNPMHEAAVRSAIEMLQNYGVNSIGPNFNPFVEPQCWTQSEIQRQGYDSNDGRPDQLPPPPPYPHVKKRLHFSPEFFEPELMARPPPVAEEFLFELRRMIDVAKGRIRNRRYMPSLEEIPEEDHRAASRKLSEAIHSPKTNITVEPLTLTQAHCREEAESPHSSGSQPESADSPANESGDSGETSNSSTDSGYGEDEKNKVAYWLSRLPPTIEIDENSSQNDEIADAALHSNPFNSFEDGHQYKELNSVVIDKLRPRLASLSQLGVVEAPNTDHQFGQPHSSRSFSHPQTTTPLTPVDPEWWMQQHRRINYHHHLQPAYASRPSGSETLPRSFVHNNNSNCSTNNNILLSNELCHHLPYAFSLPRGKVHSRPPLASNIFTLNPSSQIPVENNCKSASF